MEEKAAFFHTKGAEDKYKQDKRMENGMVMWLNGSCCIQKWQIWHIGQKNEFMHQNYKECDITIAVGGKAINTLNGK